MPPIQSVLLAITSIAIIGCAEEMYDPIGPNEDSADEICRQGLPAIDPVASVDLALVDGYARYEGTFEVDLVQAGPNVFLYDEFVYTDEVIFSIPENRSVNVVIDEDFLDFSTNLVFELDVRAAGTTTWIPVSLPKSYQREGDFRPLLDYDLLWFQDISFNRASQTMDLTSFAICNYRPFTLDEVPATIEGAFELRIRPFLFDAPGDREDDYGYTLDVTLTD